MTLAEILTQLSPLLSIALPSLIAVTGVIIGAVYLRKSQREANKNAANANDANAFKVVTDQLFADNAVLRQGLATVTQKVTQLELDIRAKDVRIGDLEDDLEDTQKSLRRQINIARQLANYIGRLISLWPANAGPPPAPEPPIDWQKHLN